MGRQPKRSIAAAERTKNKKSKKATDEAATINDHRIKRAAKNFPRKCSSLPTIIDFDTFQVNNAALNLTWSAWGTRNAANAAAGGKERFAHLMGHVQLEFKFLNDPGNVDSIRDVINKTLVQPPVDENYCVRKTFLFNYDGEYASPPTAQQIPVSRLTTAIGSVRLILPCSNIFIFLCQNVGSFFCSCYYASATVYTRLQ